MTNQEVITQLEAQLARLEEELIVRKWMLKQAEAHVQSVQDNVNATKLHLADVKRALQPE